MLNFGNEVSNRVMKKIKARVKAAQVKYNNGAKAINQSTGDQVVAINLEAASKTKAVYDGANLAKKSLLDVVSDEVFAGNGFEETESSE